METTYRSKVCQRCGAAFTTTGSKAYLCSPCRPIDKRERIAAYRAGKLQDNKSTTRIRNGRGGFAHAYKNGAECTTTSLPDHSQTIRRASVCNSSEILHAPAERAADLINRILAGKVSYAG